MTLTPEDATILCEIEERAAALAKRIEEVKASIEFEALASATSTRSVDYAMSFSAKLDQVTADYTAFQTFLRGFVAKLRLRVEP